MMFGSVTVEHLKRMQDHQSLLDSITGDLSGTPRFNGQLQWVRSLSGGDINQAALLRSGNTLLFVKYHRNAPRHMFATEALALAEIASYDCIATPQVLTHGNDGSIDWLVLEYIELGPNGSDSQLGEALAALHGVTQEQYGWNQDNYIGITPQINTRCNCWRNFWRDCRLRPQFELAQTAGFGDPLLKDGERLLDDIEQLMDGHQPAASLLHGDLWAGNKAFCTDGTPLIFDPASYYGDRETDIAMTELFGGFGPDFYAAYQEHAPLADAYRLRRNLYNLYHLLNHLNLFGIAYLSRCEQLIGELLAEIH